MRSVLIIKVFAVVPESESWAPDDDDGDSVDAAGGEVGGNHKAGGYDHQS